MSTSDLIQQAIAFHTAGQLEEAAVAYELAISQHPNHHELMINLANVLRQLNRLDEAEESVRQAIALKPHLPIAWGALSRVLWEQNKKSEAIEAIRTAIKDDPNLIAAQINLIAMLRDIGEVEQAVEVGKKALLIDPNSAEIMINLGYALKEIGQFEESLACASKAANLRPDLPHARINLGFIQLLLGDYENGFAEREKYLTTLPQQIQSRSGVTHWNGKDPSGKRLLVYAREGFGDTIMYARYLPILIERGAKLIVQVPKPLSRLIQSIPGIETVVESLDNLPSFDQYIAFPTLPAVMKTRLDSIPNQVPYLFAVPNLKQPSRSLLGSNVGKTKIGLVWSGNPANTNDAMRSIPYELIQQVSTLDNARFYSLQKEIPPGASWITDLSEHLNDFADTASIIDQLDLVISVDTAVAHLAGAMGKPVWIMLRYSPDWRWLLDREDSPWYPSARLIRQRSRGDWSGVINQVITLLREQP